MIYPPAPWKLVGHGIQSVHFVDVRDVRAFLPRGVRMVQVLPGKTLGVFAFAHYGKGSVTEYNELIVAPALVSGPKGFGVCISHIYVDSGISLAGGREIWGVPKELAKFNWSAEKGINSATAVHEDGRPLCTLSMRRSVPLFRKRMKFPTYSTVGGKLIRFVGDTVGKLSWPAGKLEIPESSPFHAIRVGPSRLALCVNEMTLECGQPEFMDAPSPELAERS